MYTTLLHDKTNSKIQDKRNVYYWIRLIYVYYRIRLMYTTG